MLSPEEKKEIDIELKTVPIKQGASVEALKIVQRHRGGWISDEALHDVAEYLEMSTAELEGVATFYSLIFRKPVGRHIILICDGMACFVMGFRTLREHIIDKLGIDYGQTTSDGRFTFLPTPCIGICHYAPAMIIDEDTHLNLTPEKIDRILEQYE